MWIGNLSTTVFFFDSWHKIFHYLNYVTHLIRLIQRPVKHLRWGFLRNYFAVNYFSKMLYFRCLRGFWICLCLRLRSLKFYLFPRNTSYVIKSRLPCQFWKLFTVVIRTRSCGSTIAMPIIFDNHNTINSWGSQERAF